MSHKVHIILKTNIHKIHALCNSYSIHPYNISKYFIENPYIILLGTSIYETEKIGNLESVKNDIKRLENMFKNKFNYKNTFSYIDKLIIDKNNELKKRN